MSNEPCRHATVERCETMIFYANALHIHRIMDKRLQRLLRRIEARINFELIPILTNFQMLIQAISLKAIGFRMDSMKFDGN